MILVHNRHLQSQLSGRVHRAISPAKILYQQHNTTSTSHTLPPSSPSSSPPFPPIPPSPQLSGRVHRVISPAEILYQPHYTTSSPSGPSVLPCLPTHTTTPSPGLIQWGARGAMPPPPQHWQSAPDFGPDAP